MRNTDYDLIQTIMWLISFVILFVMVWLPMFKRLTQFPRLVVMLLVVLVAFALYDKFGATLLLMVYFFRISLLSMVEKRVYYSCSRCGFKKGFEQRLKLYRCPQCGEENIVS